MAIRAVIFDIGGVLEMNPRTGTRAAELFDLAWADQTATGLICTSCGYVHEFVGGGVALYET